MAEGTRHEDPLEFIQECVAEGRILWTYHVNMRLKTRYITRQEILNSVFDCEIIEEYPDDIIPSHLIHATMGGKVLHVVFSKDLKYRNVRVVSAYEPDPDRWRKDFKTRRKS